MNGPIRRIAVIAMLMIGALLINSTYLITFKQDSLNANPQNRRVRDAEFAQDRGSILVGDTQIAESVPSKDRFKFQRTYSPAESYAHITGWYSYDHARSGLESSHNTELAGTDDSLFVRRIADLVSGETPKGASIKTTINAKAQAAAVEGLGQTKGAVVALNPKTGAILALVSQPTYDPNEIASHDIKKANKAYQRLVKDSDNPLTNRATREIYPPGSTFKLVTAAAALESGLEPDARQKSPARYKLPGTNTFLTNDSACGGDNITLDQALRVSCNTAFASLGVKLGDDALRAQAEKFGFGTKPLSDLDSAASKFGEDPNQAQTALSAIGQFDVAATPLQMAMVAGGIANDGVVMEPYLVSSVRAPNLSTISKHRDRQLGRAMSAANARKLQQMMVNVVDSGTGVNGQIAGVKVGGKTGTAQTSPEKPPYAWFVSMAPAEDAEVAVAVFIEEADIPRNDIAGGRLAAPIARSVMQAVLG